jgi:hypothetical protein
MRPAVAAVERCPAIRDHRCARHRGDGVSALAGRGRSPDAVWAAGSGQETRAAFLLELVEALLESAR